MIDEQKSPWPDFTYDFILSNVRIVATCGDDGGAIAENVPKLFCQEGRLESYEATEGQPLCLFEYNFHFGVSELSDPMASTSVKGRIVISGIFANGLQLEIRGDGWIGYDEKGQIEGAFHSPPVIIREDHEPGEEPDQPWGSATRRRFDFEMPPQFNAANLRVPVREIRDADM